MQQQIQQMTNAAMANAAQSWQGAQTQQWHGGNSGAGRKKKKKKRSNSGWNSGAPKQGQGRDRPPHVKNYNNDNYCWSCWHDLPPGHTGITCTWQLPNHNPQATKYNTMGGNPKNAEHMMKPSMTGFQSLVAVVGRNNGSRRSNSGNQPNRRNGKQHSNSNLVAT